MNNALSKNIIVAVSDNNQTLQVLAVVDNFLKNNGELGVYGDLSCGIDPLKNDFSIRITEDKEHYLVDIAPLNGNRGHDFNLIISKANGETADFSVGEVLPEPGI